jgi:multicomponent Na+:H+ antiporter subunit C
MTVLLALTVGVLFGTGAYLVLKRDLLRVVAGIVMISNATNLLILAVALSRGAAPIYPLPADGQVSDPVVQAMVLTAIVISFAFTALLLSLIYRVYRSHHSIDQEDLATAERAAEAELAREEIWR